LVLDNCIGSGTTAIACIRANRKFIGIEKEQQYCDIAKQRIESETSLKDFRYTLGIAS
jgi:site-specific DNA-methyltransferase (adenine-specific)